MPRDKDVSYPGHGQIPYQDYRLLKAAKTEYEHFKDSTKNDSGKSDLQ